MPQASRLKVLHIPFNFVPGQLGGTEIYVESLCRHLEALGIECAVATPSAGHGATKLSIEGLMVFEFGQDPKSGFEQAYGEPDLAAAAHFRDILKEWRPDIVHFHARTSAVSVALADEAKRIGARIMFTYHTPTVSCANGTMMHMGRVPCDGVLDINRCTMCVLHRHGVNDRAAKFLARTPFWIGACLARLGLHGGLWTALRMPLLVASNHQRFRGLMAKADRVVAVCEWVADVLRRNGISEPKLLVSRQGLPYAPIGPAEDGTTTITSTNAGSARPLLLRYFGRLDRTKGLDILLRALATIPDANFSLEIFAVIQGPGDDYGRQILKMIEQDKRVKLKAALPASEVVTAMAECDLVLVPSQWLETGPLVVLEAFAARTPVLGSRLGGIAELVSDGRDGVLVEAASVEDWALAVQRLSADRRALANLRRGIRPPRTMKQVAMEMSDLYASLI